MLPNGCVYTDATNTTVCCSKTKIIGNGLDAVCYTFDGLNSVFPSKEVDWCNEIQKDDNSCQGSAVFSECIGGALLDYFKL